MENNRKAELNTFLDYVPPENSVGIYYLNKSLSIIHYTIYKHDEIPKLRENIKSLNNQLEDSVTQVISWKDSDSEEYLVGVYDGIVEKFEDRED